MPHQNVPKGPFGNLTRAGLGCRLGLDETGMARAVVGHSLSHRGNIGSESSLLLSSCVRVVHVVHCVITFAIL